VAALASALAKAQAELINPEKSLTATIRTGRPGDGERSFRRGLRASSSALPRGHSVVERMRHSDTRRLFPGSRICRFDSED